MRKWLALVIAALLMLTIMSVVRIRQPGSSHSESSQANASMPLNSKNIREEQGDGEPKIVVSHASNEPISLVEMHLIKEGEKKGDIVVGIENVTNRPVKAVRYWLAPAPCRQYQTPTLFVDYGDRKLLNAKAKVPSEPTLNPGQRVNLVIARKDTEEYVHPTSLQDCSADPQEKPHLWLARVYFVDGSVWDFNKQTR